MHVRLTGHRSDIYGIPGRIDLLLGVETFVEVMGHGRQTGAPGSPIAFETHLGWVLAGGTAPPNPASHVAVHHASALTGDDLIRRFWENGEKPMSNLPTPSRSVR